MLSYTVQKAQDTEFFASPHYDVVSTAQIKDGDTICICDHCGKLHLQSSWDANGGQCAACSSSERRNITKAYLKTYGKAAVVAVAGRNRPGGTTRSNTVARRRFTVVSVNPVSAPSVQTVRRRPQQTVSNFYDLGDDDTDDMDYLLDYPRHIERRHVAGGILLGIVVAAIVAAVIAAVILL